MAETADDLRSQLDALRGEIVELSELDDITTEQDARLDAAIAEYADTQARCEALEARAAAVAEVRAGYDAGHARPAFDVPNVNTRTTADKVFEHDTLRHDTSEELRERALTAVEKFLPRDASDASREGATRLVQQKRRDSDILARHIIRTSAPDYVRAFEEYLENPMGGIPRVLSDYEARAAMSLTAANGGVLIPQFLDPTLNLTNAGITNPIRQIAAVTQITVDQWDGVTSAGVTAEWLSEGTQAADATPTFTGPTITPQKEAAWIFGSYEMLSDSSFNQVGMLIADAFDRLEGAGFITGTGSGQPYGLVTRLSGTGPVTTGASGEAFSTADVYALDNALGPRWRNNASWLTSQYFANVIRAATDSSENFWASYGGGLPPELIGYPVYRASTMATYPVMGAVGATTITSGSSDYPIVLGDFSMYQIVDRVGTAIMYEPMIKSTGNGRPTGQAGWFAFKRTGADVLTSNAFKTLKI